MQRWACSLLAACSFELRPGAATPDDAPRDAVTDAPVDAAIDAAIDAPAVFNPATDCPASYLLALSGQTSRYRILTTSQPVSVHGTDCNDDLPGATHLVALDDAAELTAVMIRVNATANLPGGQGCAYVGGVQLRTQATDLAGWLSITGGPLLAIWDPGEPNDGGDNVEDSAENFTMLERTRTSLIDVSGTGAFGAICECDGKPVDPAAAAAIIASAP